MVSPLPQDPAPFDLVDPSLRQLYDYWQARCRGRRMPSRADMDPLEMSFILGHLVLADVLFDPLRFRIRLHGSELVRRVGYELTGKMLDELPASDYRALVEQSFTRVVETRAPAHYLRDRVIDERLRRYEALLLPLSRDERSVEMLMVGIRYT
jgi:hypothetical protein